MSTHKAIQGSKTKTMKLLEGMKENNNFPEVSEGPLENFWRVLIMLDTKSERDRNFGSFVENFTWPKWLQSWTSNGRR